MNCRGLNKKLDSVLLEADESIRIIKACKMLRELSKKYHCGKIGKHGTKIAVIYHMIVLTGIIKPTCKEIKSTLSNQDVMFLQDELSALF